MTLTVAVFSYNRGEYLQNCLNSLFLNMPFVKVVVYDDGSNDQVTREVLQDPRLVVRDTTSSDRQKLGGLYRNMQRALDECQSAYIFFLQDDMQIVRSVAISELDAIQEIFASDEQRAFVQPLFMKASSLRRYRRKLRPAADMRAYVGPEPESPGWYERIAYYDVCIAHVQRLRASGWRFANSEVANIAQARELFSDMPLLGDPFAFYCPEVPIFRNREQSWASKIAARLSGADVKAFRDLDNSQVERLLERSINVWPVAEDWLTPENSSVRRPFVYRDVKVRWWLNRLHRVEQRFNRRR